jgi:hypothetical protein
MGDGVIVGSGPGGGCEDAYVSSSHPVRFRHHSAIVVAAVIAAIGAIPLASTGWYFLPLAIVPLLVALWAWRSGTDVGAQGLRLRALLGRRDVPWTAVAELAADGRGHAVVRLNDGRELPLPAVRATDLPRLVGAGGAGNPGGAGNEGGAGNPGGPGSVAVDHPVDQRLAGGESA